MRQINKLIIHHSGHKEYTLETIRQLHVQEYKWEDIGYHYLIDQKGTVFRGRDVKSVGAHALGYNQDSIGICLIANLDKDKLTKEQEDALIKLCKELVEKYDFDSESILTHSQISEKYCPGKNFDLERIKSLIFN